MELVEQSRSQRITQANLLSLCPLYYITKFLRSRSINNFLKFLLPGLHQGVHNVDGSDHPSLGDAGTAALSALAQPLQSELRQDRLEQGLCRHRLRPGLQHPRRLSQDDGRPQRLKDHRNTIRLFISMAGTQCVVVLFLGFRWFFFLFCDNDGEFTLRSIR